MGRNLGKELFLRGVYPFEVAKHFLEEDELKEVLDEMGDKLKGEGGLLEHATFDELKRLLQEVEKEFIPQKKFEAAERLVADVQNLDIVKDNKELSAIALRILRKCKNRG